jgi:NAD(P)-dependent dehydrogenase (short-subunit alcohol dehydrogenase family)
MERNLLMTTTGLLAEKATLIIGASAGIGAAAAREFAAEGARLVIGSRNLDALTALQDELREAGAEIEAVRIDVTDRASIDAAVQRTVDLYGSLDAAFNNSGASALANFHEYPEDEYDRMLDINLKGVFLAMQAEITAMLAGGGGAIVNTSSVGGLIGNYGIAPYIAAKHGVIGLTKTAAFEYSKRGIRTNAIAPGSTATEMFLGAASRLPHEVVERFNSSSPMDRLGEPAEIANAATWLLSDKAGFVTGATLTVDGGFTAQ